jgi:hypothetical protein
MLGFSFHLFWLARWRSVLPTSLWIPLNHEVVEFISTFMFFKHQLVRSVQYKAHYAEFSREGSNPRQRGYGNGFFVNFLGMFQPQVFQLALPDMEYCHNVGFDEYGKADSFLCLLRKTALQPTYPPKRSAFDPFKFSHHVVRRGVSLEVYPYMGRQRYLYPP